MSRIKLFVFAVFVLLLAACTGPATVSVQAPDGNTYEVEVQVTDVRMLGVTSVVTSAVPTEVEFAQNTEWVAPADGWFAVCDMTVNGEDLWARGDNPDERGEVAVLKKDDVVLCKFTSGMAFPPGTDVDKLVTDELDNGCTNGCDSVAVHQGATWETFR